MEEQKPPKRLGDLLKEKGIITEDHIRFSLQEQKITKELLGGILERLGFVTEYDVATTLADQAGVPYVDMDEVLPQQDVLKLFNKNMCLNNAFLPIRRVDNTLEVVTASIPDARLPQLVSRQAGLAPTFLIGERKKIVNAVNAVYYFLENPIETVLESEVNLLAQDREMARGMETLIRHILHLAVKMRATDIHIRPLEQAVNIAFRIDGVMRSVLMFPPALSRLIPSLKMLADLDIAEQRLPQDGRFASTILNNEYDFRVSTIVTPLGENMVLRVLPMQSAIMGMSQLGFFDEHIQLVAEMFQEPFGIILLTGPTGSGKSTTLYAGIRSLDLLKNNLITVEDPIEYKIPLIRQTQVNEKAGYSFANAIRYFLRHDPDIILVGEIRDEETASTAVSAATTGHLVLSTLHANSAVGAIPRLRDLGVRSFLISDSLVGVVSQRLVRKICGACKEEYVPEPWEKEYLREPDLERLWRGRGCEVCDGSGYLGRTLVYEVLRVDKALSRLIDQDTDLSIIAEEAKDRGFVDLFQITVEKAKQGVITTEEAVRIIGYVRQG